jgi:hypothetical protein
VEQFLVPTDGRVNYRPLESAKCVAVLFGASNWCAKAGYKPAPEFAASAGGVREYIKSPRGLDIPDRQFLDLFDSQDSAESQLRRLRTFLNDNMSEREGRRSFTDLFVFAISHGEGTRQNRHDLHLIVYATESGFVDGTGLSIRQLAASLIRTAPHLRRYIILDCCFAGAALAHFQSGAEAVGTIVAADIRRTASEVADAAESLTAVPAGVAPCVANKADQSQLQLKLSRDDLPREGTILFCSSRADDISLAKARDGRTVFTSSILRVLSSATDATPEAADVDSNLISFARLREIAWKLMWSELGESAPYPQLYAPNQQAGDLCAVPLLPLLMTGTRVIVSERKRRRWTNRWSIVAVATAGFLVVITVLAEFLTEVTGKQAASLRIALGSVLLSQQTSPIAIGVLSVKSADDLRILATRRKLEEHSADCETVKLTNYPDALNVIFKDPEQAAGPCSIGPRQFVEIKFHDGVRAFDVTYAQGLYYADITLKLRDGRTFVQTRKDFYPRLNYFGIVSDSDIDTVSIGEANNMGHADLKSISFYSLKKFRRVF